MDRRAGEQTLQELAARVAREEQANAALHEKLANIQGSVGERQTFAAEALTLNSSAETASGAAPSTVQSIASRSPHRRFFTRWQVILLVVLAILLVGGVVSHARLSPTSPVGKITEFPLSSKSSPGAITAGPDGNLWFTENMLDSKVGRITLNGTITEFPFSTPQGSLEGITAGPDGNLWFVEYNRVARITPQGKLTQFLLPTPSSYLWDITTGPDGNLWFTYYIYNNGSWIGRITSNGTITAFALSTSGYPYGITKGPDGNLWFTIDGQGANLIGRITPSGTFTEFSLPTAGNSSSEITAGPDGNLWFTDPNGNKIGRITPSGTITEYALPTPDRSPYGIAAGADGNLWFTELSGNRIGRITPAGMITEFSLPKFTGYDPSHQGSTPFGIASGADDNLWFTESSSNKIGRITTGT
jgi:streptogramin lyase